ncbi:hypothetical protein [Saliphagus infecundisoli]|uniref:Small CPxCG-related zinc finger protein n=1 Tax=Saliphagus infecundisoli TaxID=1849069 RepID=A0ABD5Q9C0_9EURY|nr:hypothetical protein [Saliphagus infecundisoli]
MITASEASDPIVAEFTPEPPLTLESRSVHFRVEVLTDPECTNTSCDFCGRFGVVERDRWETAENLDLPLICPDCE